MGKTESGAIWLDEKYLSAYDYWQFWRNVDDRDVIKFLKMFTEIEIKEIETIKDKDINELKILLANKTTEMLHGKEAAENSEKAAKEAFSGNALGANLPKVNIHSKKIEEKIKDTDINQLKVLLANKTTEKLHGKDAAKNSEQAAKEAFSGNTLGSNIPKVNVQSNKIEEKINIVDLVLLSKLENSKSEIRRLIKGNAIKINDDVISDEKFEINKSLFKDKYLKLSLGKKRHIKIELN